MADTEIIEVDKALILPDKIKGAIMAVVNIVKIQEIESDAAFEGSGRVLDQISESEKEVTGHFETEIKKRHAAHREATTARGNFLKPLTEAVKIWRAKINAYSEVMGERVRAEQKKVDDEAREKAEDDRLTLAEEHEKRGNIAAADAVIEDKTEPIIVSPKVEAPKAKGVSVGEVWCGEVEDLMALAIAVAAGNAPPTLLQGDDKAISAFAKSTRGSMKINGIRFYSKPKVGRSGRRGG